MSDLTDFRPPTLLAKSVPLQRQWLGGLLDGFNPPASRAHNGLDKACMIVIHYWHG